MMPTTIRQKAKASAGFLKAVMSVSFVVFRQRFFGVFLIGLVQHDRVRDGTTWPVPATTYVSVWNQLVTMETVKFHPALRYRLAFVLA